MRLTIEELADKVNDLVAEHFKNNAIKDGRQSSVLSTRRIRDYITKGLLEKPIGNGREKWFDESHVNALVSLRLLQHNGLSEQYILSSTKSEPMQEIYAQSNNSQTIDSVKTDEDMKNGAMSFLRSLSGTTNSNKELNIKAQSASLSGSGIFAQAANALVGSTSSSPRYAAPPKQEDFNLMRSYLDSQTKYRQFNEYPVDETLGVYLKVDSKMDIEQQKKLLETLKKEIINLKGDKND